MADDINITPKNNSFLLGQEKAEQVFLQAWKNQNMHHAWILNGPKGIGNSTLASRLARFLLWADANTKETYTSLNLSLIPLSAPTILGMHSYAVFCFQNNP